METPVLVELRFPRSGQLVSVQVPFAMARCADTLRADSENAYAPRTAAASTVHAAGETIRHTR